MNNRLLSMLVVALAASGCSGEKASGDAPTAVKAPVAAGADAVAAVLQSGGTPIAKLGFVVVTRPMVGAQSDLRLDLSSVAPVPELQVHSEGEAITIDPATAKASVSLESGKTASHTVRLTPQREGLTRVTVRLRSGADSAETVYDIPVLVGAAASGG
jgi:hypothetical protein